MTKPIMILMGALFLLIVGCVFCGEAEAHLWWNVTPGHAEKYCAGNIANLDTRNRIREAQGRTNGTKVERGIDAMDRLCEFMKSHPRATGYRIIHE
jgi:hypothetical protein